jgi:hypothetical protein
MVAAGMTLPEIAAVLEISRSTLCEHYRIELATGRARRRAEVIEQLRKAVRSGNVSAMRTLLDLFGFPTQSGRLGVKAQRELAAQNAGAGTEWESPEHGNDLEPPPLAMRQGNVAAKTDWALIWIFRPNKRTFLRIWKTGVAWEKRACRRPLTPVLLP